MHKIPLLFIFIAVLGLSVFAQNDKKAQLKEIIEKHLESIGIPEKRALNRQIVGNTDFRLKYGESPMPNLSGKSKIISEDNSSYFQMSFVSRLYTYEEFAFDGKESTYLNLFLKESSVRRERTGQQSIAPLTIFCSRYPEIIKYGLFGGTLTSAWLLQNLQDHSTVKFELGKSKKIDGKDLFVINVQMPGNTFKNLKIYLDTSTFKHIRSDFNTATGDWVSEEYTEFTNENGLNLPHKLKISAGVASVAKLRTIGSPAANSSEYEWKTTFTGFLFDQKFDADIFQIKTKS
jgi:hypothetical protein